MLSPASLLLLLLGPAAVGAEGFLVEPELPAWVVPQEVPAVGTVSGERLDVQYLLIDEQVRVGHDGTAAFNRRADRVGSVTGVQRGSELSFEFDPSWQRLVLHHVRLVRGSEVIDALQPDELKVVQQERDFDRRIYNGTLSVLAFLHDVRVGDVIDYAWTVEGDNPALGGHYADAFGLGYEVPVGRLHRRLLWPSDRPLHVRAHAGAPEPERVVHDEVVEYVWALDAVPAVEVDPRVPAHVDVLPWAQLSDFGTWGEVVDWALPHYRLGDPDEALTERIAEWRTLPTEEARARAALQMVEDEVRYLGIEIGPRGLIPHDPAETYARRFGDCKDKSMLLATALRAMGIEASPALVHTRRRRGVADLHPTPYGFDHAIVRAVVDGEVVWLDGTRSLERGPVTALEPPDVEVALVLHDGTTALEPVPVAPQDEPVFDLFERFVLTELDGPVELEVEAVYRGRDAARMRGRFQSQPLEDIGRDYLRDYQRLLPDIEVLSLPEASEGEDGSFRVRERYRAGTFWDDGWFHLTTSALRSLDEVPPGARTQPLATAHPEHARHVLELHLPVDFDLSPWHEVVQSDAFRYEVDVTYDDDVVRASHTYRSLAAEVSPAGLERHREAVEAAGRHDSYGVPRAAVVPGMSLEVKGALAGTGFVLLVFVGGPAGRALRRWRTSLALRTRMASTDGSSPDDPLVVADTAEALRALQRTRCSCGGSLDTTRRRSESVRGPNGQLLQVEVPCTRCDTPTTRWFAFRRG